MYGKKMLAAVASAALFGSLAACGSSEPQGAGEDSTAASGDSSDLVAAAQEVYDISLEGLIYASKDAPTAPEEIEPYGDWRGPTDAPELPEGANVQVIVCTKQAVACMEGAQGVVDAGKKLGWKVEIIDGAGTPEGFANAFDTAFSRDPDAIASIAVPALAVGDKLEQAAERGILTAVTGDVPPTGGETPYDSYVSFRMPLMMSLVAFAEIARTDGKADSIVVTDSGIPSLIQAMGQYKDVLATCDGCSVTDVSWTIADAVNPTKVASIVNGAISQNPDATSLVVPYAIGLPAVIQAVESAGKADQIKILTKDADQVGLQAVEDGQVFYNAGASPTWAGWAVADQIIRGLADAPYLGEDETGLGLMAFTEDNVPPNGIDSADAMIDYASEYAKAWGVE
jgi:ribose transport system substrate-binding protein